MNPGRDLSISFVPSVFSSSFNPLTLEKVSFQGASSLIFNPLSGSILNSNCNLSETLVALAETDECVAAIMCVLVSAAIENTRAFNMFTSSKTVKLSSDFYQQEDVLAISQALLGMWLFTRLPDSSGKLVTCAGVIVETEAYRAPDDKASHAYNYRRTQRTETMFCAGGVAYVYLCYGIHHLFNVVTGPKDCPHAVLIRAVNPVVGIEHMMKRRGLDAVQPRLSSGPGALTMALGIQTKHDRIDLGGDAIWIEDRGREFPVIQSSPRIGVDYAGDCALLPWRFFIAGDPFVSRMRIK